MEQSGGDNTISQTFNKAADITKTIGDFTGNIPVVGAVTKPIFDIFGDVGNGISSAFSWLGLGSHVNQIEDHLQLKPLTKEEIEFYDRVEDGEERFADYIHKVGSSHHGGSISNVLGTFENLLNKYNNANLNKIPLVGNTLDKSKIGTRDAEHLARISKQIARYFGLGQNINQIKGGLGLKNDKIILDNYYGKEYASNDVQDILNEINNDAKKEFVIESIDGGKYIIDGGKYIIDERNGGKYIVEGSSKDNDSSKWITGSNAKNNNNKTRKQLEKELNYIIKLVLRAKRLNHVLNKQ